MSQLAAVGLGVVLFAGNDGFSNQDQPAFEVDVLPLQPIHFARAHHGEETNDRVVPEIRPNGINQPLHFVKRERFDVYALNLELLDILDRHTKIETVGG